MKRLLALLLTAALMLSLTACGEIAPTDGNQNDPQSGSEDNIRYAQEFTDILCTNDWVCREGDSVLSFNADRTVRFHYGNNEEDGIRAWEYDTYLNSFDDYTAMLQHDPEFSEKFGVYCGSMEQYGQILVGFNDDGSDKMYFNGRFWDPAEKGAQGSGDSLSSEIRINNENWQEYLEFVYSDVPFFTHENEEHHILYGAYTALVLKDEYVAQMDYENAFSEADLEQMNTFEFLVGEADENKSPIFFNGTLQLGKAPILDKSSHRIDLEASKEPLTPTEPHISGILHKCQINGKDTYAAFFWTSSKLVDCSDTLTETAVYWGNPIDDSMFYGVLKLK